MTDAADGLDPGREPDRTGGLLRHIGLRTATGIVVANIIGAGIFTTTGFQAADLPHPGWLFLLWIVGGALAVCGALSYAELGAMMPRAGAEYAYLRETYGPALGFMSAFVSLVAGFSAPVAAALEGLARYLGQFFPVLASDEALFTLLPGVVGSPRVTAADLAAAALVWVLVAVHLRGMRGGTLFNDLVTLVKVVGIAAILLAAAAIGRGDAGAVFEVSPRFETIGTADRIAAFATSLIFVMFCYSGWNASAYVASELRDPERDLPRSLLLGTGLVVVLYLGLNAVYLYGAGVEGLAGKVEVGLVAARGLFGELGVDLVTIILAVSIFASASAMTIIGPRVTWAFGRDVPGLGFLSRTSPRTGAPTTALVVQGLVTTAFVFSGRVDQIQQYSGLTLALFASLAVSCVIVLRIRRPNAARPFRVPLYPLPPLLFLGVMIWTMAWAFRGRPLESIAALATVVAGGLLFAASSRRRHRAVR